MKYLIPILLTVFWVGVSCIVGLPPSGIAIVGAGAFVSGLFIAGLCTVAKKETGK